MNVVDSSSWLEYFAGGPNAGFFAAAIKATDTLVVPTICIYEVFKRLLTQRGEEDALQAIGIMSLGVIAAHASTEFQIAMADSIILATARAHNAILWTQDSDFEGMDSVQYISKK